MLRYLFKRLLLAFLFTGCAVSPPEVSDAEVEMLAKALVSLDKGIPYSEAMHLSRDVFSETRTLVKAFKLTSPPLFHNFLVNTGMREKGLCYHWSDALYRYVSAKKYPHFSFHLAGANIGEYFFEHNTLVVTAKGGTFEEGVIIDPWRNSGKLYFCKLKDDKAYRWVHRLERGCCKNCMVQKGR
jgi:hypothetical protein